MNDEDATPEEEGDPLREAAADALSLIVESAQLEPILRRVLAQPAGAWLDVKAASEGFARLQKPFAVIDELAESPLLGTWLELPASSPNPGYCLVLFLIEEPLWTGSALLNRSSLEAGLEVVPPSR